MSPRIPSSLICLALCLGLTGQARLMLARSDSDEEDEPRSSREIATLFRQEIQEVPVKLKWRGEKLSEDTLYAAALTGLSWQDAWGKSPLFSMAWGDSRKADVTKGRKPAETLRLISEVDRRFQSGDFRGTVEFAESHFTQSEIGLSILLKTAVGDSLARLNAPERAFAIYASPFEPAKKLDNSSLNRDFRLAAYTAATKASQRQRDENERIYRRNSIAFGLSLLLQPDTAESELNRTTLAALERQGVDLDRVALGILQAPDRLSGLSEYSYVASDLLLLHASPRLLPYMMHLAQSDDVHLRSRAVVSLGVLAATVKSSDSSGWSRRLVPNAIREIGLSSGERKMVEREAMEAVRSGNYRLRVAGAMALGLLGDEKSVPLLQKLTKDPAYTLSPQIRGQNWRTIRFPVREAASAATYRFGFRWNPGGGEFSGKQLDQAKRGGQDVSNDHGGLKKEMAPPLKITPLDKD